MSVPGTLDFGGLVFDGRGDSSVSQYGWHLGNMDGWYDGPPSKANSDSRPQNHGSFRVGKYYRGARVVSVEGSFSGADMLEAEQARERLASLQAEGQASAFIYVEPSLGARTIEAVLVNGPTMPARLFSPYFKFAFDVLATDPKKYGEEVSVATGLPVSGTGLPYPITYPLDFGATAADGRVNLYNAGTTDTSPVYEITGELTAGFSLVEVGSGREIRFERFIPADSVVVVDSRTGRAYIDAPGNDVSGFLTVADWWSVPGGASSLIQFTALGGSSGTPTLTARIAPAYW